MDHYGRFARVTYYISGMARYSSVYRSFGGTGTKTVVIEVQEPRHFAMSTPPINVRVIKTVKTLAQEGFFVITASAKLCQPFDMCTKPRSACIFPIEPISLSKELISHPMIRSVHHSLQAGNPLCQIQLPLS